MADDWHPSHYKPRGGWRASLPRLSAVLVALVVAAYVGFRMFFLARSGEELSFKLMLAVVGIIGMACVAPQNFGSAKPRRPGEFPTERNDEAPCAADDKKT